MTSSTVGSKIDTGKPATPAAAAKKYGNVQSRLGVSTRPTTAADAKTTKTEEAKGLNSTRGTPSTATTRKSVVGGVTTPRDQTTATKTATPTTKPTGAAAAKTATAKPAAKPKPAFIKI